MNSSHDDDDDDNEREKNDASSNEKAADCNRKWLLVFSVLYITLYAGAFFGWGFMQLMLEENGAFESKCNHAGEELPCASQTTRLLNVQLVATFSLIFAPLLGMLSDKHGAFSLMCLAATCGITGLALLTLTTASHKVSDNWLFLTFLSLGFMAVSCSIMIVETGMLFGNKTRQRVISVLNTLYDAGALTYLALWAIQQATNAALQLIAGIYLAVGVACFGGALYFWHIVIPVSSSSNSSNNGHVLDTTEETVLDADLTNNIAESTSEKKVNQDEELENCAQEHVSGSSTVQHDKDSRIIAHDDSVIPVVLDDDELHQTFDKGDAGNAQHISCVAQDADSLRRQVPKTAVSGGSLDLDDKDSNEDPLMNESLPPNENDYVLVAMRPPMEQIKSKQFLTLVVFFAFYGARNVFVLTTARDFLAYLGDDETGNKYLSIFTLLTPASMAGLPFMDWIVNHYGYHAALQSINVLSMTHGMIQVSSDNLNVQVLGFVVFSFFRCFLFTIVFSFLPTFMGGPVVGRGAGIMTCAMGCLLFINIPLSNLAINQFDGNFFWPNLFYTVGSVPFFLAAWSMGKGIQKENVAKENLGVGA